MKFIGLLLAKFNKPMGNAWQNIIEYRLLYAQGKGSDVVKIKEVKDVVDSIFINYFINCWIYVYQSIFK